MYKWLHYFDRNHPVSINEDREELESLRVEMRGYLSKDGNKIQTERGDIHLIPQKEIVPKQKIPIIKKKTEKIKPIIEEEEEINTKTVNNFFKDPEERKQKKNNRNDDKNEKISKESSVRLLYDLFIIDCYIVN